MNIQIKFNDEKYFFNFIFFSPWNPWNLTFFFFIPTIYTLKNFKICRALTNRPIPLDFSTGRTSSLQKIQQAAPINRQAT